MRLIAATLIAIVTMVTVQAAQCATIQREFTFTSMDFIALGGSDPAPVDPVTGKVIVQFDPAGGTVTDSTAGIQLLSLNINLGSPIAFDYDPAFDRLTIGGLSEGANQFSFAENDFFLVFRGASGSPFGGLLSYAQSDPTTAWEDFSNVRVSASAVPEPATWVMVLIGFSSLGVAMRRRRFLPSA